MPPGVEFNLCSSPNSQQFDFCYKASVSNGDLLHNPLSFAALSSMLGGLNVQALNREPDHFHPALRGLGEGGISILSPSIVVRASSVH